MIKILTGIGCIVVLLILMIPPMLFGYALCDGDESLVKPTATLLVIEFVALLSAFIYGVNMGVFG